MNSYVLRTHDIYFILRFCPQNPTLGRPGPPVRPHTGIYLRALGLFTLLFSAKPPYKVYTLKQKHTHTKQTNKQTNKTKQKKQTKRNKTKNKNKTKQNKTKQNKTKQNKTNKQKQNQKQDYLISLYKKGYRIQDRARKY